MANNVIKGCGFHHVALQTSDFEKSLKFYTEGLGFQLRTRWVAGSGKQIALVDLGDRNYFELFSDGEKTDAKAGNAGSYFHLALRVDDTRAAFARAVECGAEPLIEPKDVELGEGEVVHASLSFVKGPDGEEVEFFEEH
ncbi:MAG: VOC family protein [Clostridia bacterium]|nr:VOC family protein [Clostridia bacterium]